MIALMSYAHSVAIRLGLIHFKANHNTKKTNLALLSAFVTSAKEVMFLLSVCLLATLHKNFQTALHEIFREGWQ